MKTNILPAIRLTFVCMLFFSGIYTLLIWSAARLSSHSGDGELLRANGKVYYANVGQKFTDDSYFWSRPSAVEYNAAGAGGSNKGPSNPVYLNEVKERIDTFLAHNPGVQRVEIPSELVTASGSGLDPHISVQAAWVQVKRIARVRNIAEGNIQQLILSNTEKPLFDIFGTEVINVLKLNLALDALK